MTRPSLRSTVVVPLLLACVATWLPPASPAGARGADLRSARQGAPEVRVDARRPPGRRGFFVQGEDDGRFQWRRGEGFFAVIDSTEPSARLVTPLPFTLDGTDSFVLDTELIVHAIDGSPDDFMQLSFGLVNLETTGLNRTGTALPGPPFFDDDSDVHDMVELAYFPNVTPFGGPTLQPAVFGEEVGSAFANFAANFGPSADLGDNTGEQITELPVGRRLRVSLLHDACRELLVTRIFDLDAGGVALRTGLLPLDLSALNATGTFTVDAFALNAFEDLADFDRSTRSLFAEVQLLGFELDRLPPLSAALRPRVVQPRAQAPAKVRVEGWLPAPGTEGAEPSARLVEVDGAPVDVELDVRGVHDGMLVVEVPRESVGSESLVIDLDGCLVPVDGPRARPAP